MTTQVITLSSKGQISIPKNIRELLSIDSGDKLVAYATKDALILKTLKLPSVDEFEIAMDEAQNWAASVGYQESDVEDIIKSVRNSKHK